MDQEPYYYFSCDEETGQVTINVSSTELDGRATVPPNELSKINRKCLLRIYISGKHTNGYLKKIVDNVTKLPNVREVVFLAKKCVRRIDFGLLQKVLELDTITSVTLTDLHTAPRGTSGIGGLNIIAFGKALSSAGSHIKNIKFKDLSFIAVDFEVFRASFNNLYRIKFFGCNIDRITMQTLGNSLVDTRAVTGLHFVGTKFKPDADFHFFTSFFSVNPNFYVFTLSLTILPKPVAVSLYSVLSLNKSIMHMDMHDVYGLGHIKPIQISTPPSLEKIDITGGDLSRKSMVHLLRYCSATCVIFDLIQQRTVIPFLHFIFEKNKRWSRCIQPRGARPLHPQLMGYLVNNRKILNSK